MSDQPILAPLRRYNPLAGGRVLVSPLRTQGPWQGQVEKRSHDDEPGPWLEIVEVGQVLRPAGGSLVLSEVLEINEVDLDLANQ